MIRTDATHFPRTAPEFFRRIAIKGWIRVALFLGFLASQLLMPGHARAGKELPLSRIVYSFPVPASSPLGELVQGNDGFFYGTTSTGGAGGGGTIFKMAVDGTLTTLVEFTGNGAKNKGSTPYAGLALGRNGNFYGTTAKGGANDMGTIFVMTPDGILTTLVEFSGAGDTNRGAEPSAALVQASDGNFYGTTSRGGLNDLGTVFSMAEDGTLNTLVEFTGNEKFWKGAYPYAALVEGADRRLYGTTSQGGAKGKGTAFAVTTDGVEETLVEFTDNGPKDRGAGPYGALIIGSDGNFYGTTARGGARDFGTVFRMTPAGKLTTLVEFTGNAGNHRGALPEAALILGADGDFYGTTFRGGVGDKGTVFKVTASGTLTTLVRFTGTNGLNKGGTPGAALFLAQDGSYYGTTSGGGTGDAGTVFKMSSDGTVNTIAEFPTVDFATYSLPGVVLGSDQNTYGATTASGVHGKGTLFNISFDGILTSLAEFTGDGSVDKGAFPRAPLLQVGAQDFLGTTAAGGANDLGTIFKIAADGTLSTLVEFTGNGATNKGASPKAALVRGIDGTFFGTTAKGGANDLGTVFQMAPDGTLTTLAEFTGNGPINKGALPDAPLVLGRDGIFYGTTSKGGAKDLGTIFAMTPAGALTTLVEFADDPAGIKGAYPEAGLILGNDGNYYGTTSSGGATGDGTIFRVTPSGVLTTLVEFVAKGAQNRGSFPLAALFLASDGGFYGTTAFGGAHQEGTAFKLTSDGVLTTLVDFDDRDIVSGGAYPEAGFDRGSDGNIYSTTSGGGAFGAGTVFQIRLRASTIRLEAGDVQPDSVRLSATMRTGGLKAAVGFQYGTTINYGSTTEMVDIGSGSNDVSLVAELTGLLPNTTYHYRTLATDSSGTVVGKDHTFATEPLAVEVIATASAIANEPVTTTATSFGIPSIADDGTVAVLATLATADGKQAAILVGNPPVVAVRTMDAAPKADGTSGLFQGFSDPVCDSVGHITFAAQIRDGATTRTGLWTNASGQLQEIALAGDDVQGVQGNRFQAIISFAMSSTGEVFYVATMAGPGTRSSMGLWAFDDSGNHLLLRQGDALDGSVVKSFNVLSAVAGSPGQGRYRDDTIVARTTYTDNTEGIVQLGPVFVPSIVARTPLFLGGHPPFKVGQSFGIPTVGVSGTSVVLGTLANKRNVILANTPLTSLQIVAEGGGAAPGFDQVSFDAFADPVYNAQSTIAFVSTLSGLGVTAKNNSAVWWTSQDGFQSIARTGSEPAGIPGARWASFTSLALPDNSGPVFVAKLAAGINGTELPAGVNGTNNMGVWGVDSSGDLRLLVRTGDVLHVEGQSKTLSLMTLLNPVLGSPGQARSYNGAQDIVFRAQFTDRSQAIMRIHLP